MISFTRDEERDIYEAMAGVRLRPGQALWLGPRSVAIIAGRETHAGGKLPDKMILNKDEWQGLTND